MFFKWETLSLVDIIELSLYPCVSGSFVASFTLVQIFSAVYNSYFTVDLERLGWVRFVLCTLLSLSHVSRILRYSMYEKNIGLVTLYCLTCESVGYFIRGFPYSTTSKIWVNSSTLYRVFAIHYCSMQVAIRSLFYLSTCLS